jgi:hypothetical protein
MKKKKAICINCRTIFTLGKEFVEVFGVQDGLYLSRCAVCRALHGTPTLPRRPHPHD